MGRNAQRRRALRTKCPAVTAVDVSKNVGGGGFTGFIRWLRANKRAKIGYLAVMSVFFGLAAIFPFGNAKATAGNVAGEVKTKAFEWFSPLINSDGAFQLWEQVGLILVLCVAIAGLRVRSHAREAGETCTERHAQDAGNRRRHP